MKLREALQLELRRIQQELGTTTIYVTHDQTEALAMSDRVAIMDGGRIVQVGTPAEIYEQPASEFVARFVGQTNLLTTRVARLYPPGTYHRSLHTRRYFQEVNSLLRDATTKEDGLAILAYIREQLLDGTFPR